MQADKISVTYARALLESALDADVLEQVAGEAESLRAALAGDTTLRIFFESPRIERGKKRSVIERALGDPVSKAFRQFLLVCLHRGREPLFPSILAAFSVLHDVHIGLVRVRATSAEAMGDEARQQLESRLAAKLARRVVLTNDVDPEILGGLVVRFDGRVADGSLKTALGELRARALRPKFGSQLVHEN